MKRLFLLSVLLLVGCGETETCDCIQETHQWENIQLESGAMVCSFPELVKTERVPCQDEIYETTSDTTYVVVICDQ